MQRVVSFNICATFILFGLLCSLFSSKKTKSVENKTFLCIVLLTFISSICDIFRWVIPDNNFSIYIKYSFSFIYFIARTFISSAYLIYVLAMTKLWYKIDKKKIYYILLLLFPCCIFLTLVFNIFTKSIFYYDENFTYICGNLIYLIYIFSLFPFVVSFILLIKERGAFTKLDGIISLLIYPCVIVGIVIQILSPRYLLGNITTTFAVFIISLIFYRPEENLNSTTQTLGFNAYIQDLNKNLLVGIPSILVFIHVDNYKQIKRQFSTRNYNNFLKKLIELLYEKGGIKTEIYNLDNCNFVLSYLNVNYDDVLIASEKIQIYLNEFTYKNIQMQLVTTLCVVKVPEELTDVDKILTFSNNFYKSIEYKNVVTYLHRQIAEKDFKLRTELDDIIKHAIKEKKFEVYYQPIYNVKAKKFTSAEALVRLPHDEYGYIPPSMFIPAAEASGAIHEIGKIVIDQVCEFITERQFEKLGVEYIEINLSVSQCLEQNFADKLIKTLKEKNIDTKKVNLEITESAGNLDKDVTAQNINQLSKNGLTFSLDDYGTGYSNIKRLSSMPLSIIKLDKAFVDEYEKNEMNIVIKETIDMFKKLNKQILVEGIENRRTCDYFIKLGCDYIQGYYYSKPVPKSEFVHFVRTHNKSIRGIHV